MFEQSILENSIGKGRKTWTMLASICFQVVGVTTMVIIPLVFTEVLPAVALKGILTAPVPPPPSPPPPPAADLSPAKPGKPKPKPCILCVIKEAKEHSTKKEIADPDKVGELPKLAGPGVPGGIGPGTSSGPIGGLTPAAPPPPLAPKTEPDKPKEVVRSLGPIQVGGNVQQAKLINKVVPVYPQLAKASRVQGMVRFTAIIGRDGTIQQLQLGSGHPLLVPAATDAVKRWVYKPTLLNGEPVEVMTQIDVNFTLSN